MTDLSNSPSGSSEYEGYVLPAENAAEMARLMLQDHLLTEIMGGPIPELTDLSQMYRVLDVACGPGGWLFDMVTQHPHIQGVGVDISQLMIDYANSQAKLQGLAQLRFRVMDVTKPLDFPDSSFDLVNGRIFSGFLATQQWPALLQECYRITRPGGPLRLTEPEWGFTNSAAYDKYMGFLAQALYQTGHSFSPHGRTIGTANMLPLLLRQAGYQEIQYQANAVNYAVGAKARESSIQNALIVCKLFQPFFLQLQLATQEELQSLYEQMEADMQTDDFCAVDYYLTVWGYKRG
jgi:ubiquinone/menaquinone biosynthesis C-methylase UbiE